MTCVSSSTSKMLGAPLPRIGGLRRDGVRDKQDEPRATERAIGDMELAALGFSRGARDRQPEAGPEPAVTQTFEAGEHPVTRGGGDAGPGVTDFDTDRAVFNTAGDRDRSSRWSVHGHIFQHVAQG